MSSKYVRQERRTERTHEEKNRSKDWPLQKPEDVQPSRMLGLQGFVAGAVSLP
jgi:hypothetical protein